MCIYMGDKLYISCVYICICVIMGRMQIVITDELEDKLRKKAGEKFGVKKGSISEAVEEAVEAWVKGR